MKNYLAWLLASVVCVTFAQGQNNPLNLPGRTTLVMAYDVGNGFAPAAQASRVRVPPGEQVTLMLPASVPAEPGTSLQWTKNGVLIPGATSASLPLGSVRASDTGLYSVRQALTGSFFYLGISLDVVPAGSVTNVSSRLALKAGDDLQIFGFVVTGSRPKRLLIRATGPSLAAFNVPSPAPLPRIRLFDGQGNAFGPTPTPEETAATDWAGLFRQVGAFPLTGGERLGAMVRSLSFPPGSYTIQVNDDSGTGGTTLVEVYEVP